MHAVRNALLLCLASVWLADGVGAHSRKTHQVEFVYKDVKNWRYILPQETWTPVRDQVGIPHAGGSGFVVERVSSTALAVDTNGDGRVDRTIKGLEGFLTLKAKDADGEPFSYGLHFRSDGRHWSYSTGGVLFGRVAGSLIQLVDQNNDGSYDDYGIDAMIIGEGKAASYLSRVANIDGDLYHLDLEEEGRQATLRPYEGETGFLDVMSGFRSEGDLVAAVVVCDELSFNAAHSSRLEVPVGTYTLASGYVKRKRSESVRLKSGRMKPIEVQSDTPTEFGWGSPVHSEFTYDLTGEMLTVRADARFFGAAGEEYYSFLPNTQSPKVLVSDAETGRVVMTGRFEECCEGGFLGYSARVPLGKSLEVRLEYPKTIFGDIRGIPRSTTAPTTSGR